MKTKKHFFSLLTLLMIVVCSFSLVSCGGDDEDEETPKVVSPVVGTWQTIPYFETAHANVHFDSDGTYILSLTSSNGTSTYRGTYESTKDNDGVLKLFNSDGEGMDFWEYHVSEDGKTMTTNSVATTGDFTWERQ